MEKPKVTTYAVKQFRKDFQISQNELADMLDVDSATVSRFENGQRQLSEEKEEFLYKIIQSYQRQSRLDFKIDYLRLRIPGNNVDFMIEEILQIKKEFFKNEENHLYGYIERYSLLDIWVFNSVPGDERGVLLQLSGQGCRLFEYYLTLQNRSWFQFLSEALAKGANIPRIDLAIDDYQEYFSLPQVIRKLDRKEYVTQFRSIRLLSEQKGEEKERQGVSIYFGSRKSDFHIVFYQKNYEIARRENKDVRDIAVKNRYELRFSDNYAHNVVNELLKTGDIQSIVLGVLARKITLLARNKKDVWHKWARFLDDAEFVKISSTEPVSAYLRLKKKQNFVNRQALASVLLLGDIDKEIGSNILGEIKEEVRSRKNEMNDYLFKIATTELKDMIIRDLL